MACPIQGLLGLLLRSSGAVGSAIEVTTAQDFERPRLSHPHLLSTLCSALVHRASQNVISWTNIFVVPLDSGDRVFGVAGESMRPGGHVLGARSPKYEVLGSDQKVSDLD